MSSSMEDPIEPYLDDLLGRLRGTSGEVRRALGESEAHLRDSASQLVSEGCSEQEASRRAVADFGDVATVAAGFNRTLNPARRRALVWSLLCSAWQLTGIGLTAIGISGVVAWVTMYATSASAVFADRPGTRYSTGACSYWLRLHPSAATCARAALLEGRDDALFQRFALGMLGIVLLLALHLWKRRSRRQPQVDLRVPSAVIGAAAFGLAGVFLTGYGIDRAVQNTGAGQWLASGGVALICTVAYLVTLRRASPPWSAALALLSDR